MRSLAAILDHPNQPLRVAELEIPILVRGQVLVNMEWSGLCRSQLMEIRGERGPDRYLPHLLGHEGVGLIEDIGPGVTKVKKGDRVVISWIRGSGIQAEGPVYHDQKTSINAGSVATFATRAIISENCCVVLERQIPSDVASLLGCAVPTGAGIVMNEMKPKRGNSIIVWGVGGIGLAAISGAVICGCDPIVAVDLFEEKLNLAKDFGASHTFASEEVGLDEILLGITGGMGFDFAVEAGGHAHTIEKAFSFVKDGGGLCIFASHPPKHEYISLKPHCLIRGKQIRGSWGGACDLDLDVPRFANLYLKGKMPLESLITHKFDLHEINEAFKVLEEGRCGRVLLNLRTN
jgi:S-(hydroxymethyl)glutathione dehydrogenase / alcohol dehydrogenase